jgi:hypothetical protein
MLIAVVILPVIAIFAATQCHKLINQGVVPSPIGTTPADNGGIRTGVVSAAL